MRDKDLVSMLWPMVSGIYDAEHWLFVAEIGLAVYEARTLCWHPFFRPLPLSTVLAAALAIFSNQVFSGMIGRY